MPVKVAALNPIKKRTRVPPERPLRIVNYVCVCKIAIRTPGIHGIPLIATADALAGRYARHGFPCVNIKSIRPKVAMHMFPEAVITCGGDDEYKDAVTMWRGRRRLRTELKIATRMYGYAPRNAVGAVAVGYAIDLEKFYADFSVNGKCDYEHENYPGVRYHPNPKLKRPCVILHAPGTINVVGTSGIEEAKAILDSLHIERYRLATPASSTVQREKAVSIIRKNRASGKGGPKKKKLKSELE